MNHADTYLRSFMPNMDMIGAVQDEETDAGAPVALLMAE